MWRHWYPLSPVLASFFSLVSSRVSVWLSQRRKCSFFDVQSSRTCHRIHSMRWIVKRDELRTAAESKLIISSEFFCLLVCRCVCLCMCVCLISFGRRIVPRFVYLWLCDILSVVLLYWSSLMKMGMGMGVGGGRSQSQKRCNINAVMQFEQCWVEERQPGRMYLCTRWWWWWPSWDKDVKRTECRLMSQFICCVLCYVSFPKLCTL